MPITDHNKHRAQMQLGLIPIHVMRLDTTPTCMRYRHQQQGRHLIMQQKHHKHLHFEYKVFDHLNWI